MENHQKPNENPQPREREFDLLKMAFETFHKAQSDLKGNQSLNVFIAGKTGAGKSTLVNAIFGKEVAKTGSGSPITQEIEKYSLNDHFHIYDTKGLEMKDFDQTIGNIKESLDENSKKPSNEQIHIAWLCLPEPGRRIEAGEKELYRYLLEKNYPTVLVITKAQQDKDDKGERFSDLVREGFGIKDETLLQRVRALEIEDDDGEIKPIKGIDELIQKTYEILPKGRRTAFAREQQYNKELKEKEALMLINKYAAGAGAIAASPIPFSDIALLLPEQMAMITHISVLYGFEMSAESIGKLTAAFVAVAAAGFGARFAVGTALKFIPGLGTIAGGAFNVAAAAGVTKLMGNAYLAFLNDHFELIYSGDFDLLKELDKDVIEKYIDIVKSLKS